MKVGMLWLDGAPEGALDQRLARAAAYYRAKYGRQANVAVVHPETAGPSPERAVDGMTVCVRTDILRDHFWIGVEDSADGAATERVLRPDSPVRP